MKKLANNDKIKHFIGGAIIVAAPVGLRLVGVFPDTDFALVVKAGLLLCCAVAVAVELYDANNSGTPDGVDFVSTITGGLFAAAMMV